MSETTELSAAAMRAADRLWYDIDSDIDRQAIASIIDAETGLPELIAIAEHLDAMFLHGTMVHIESRIDKDTTLWQAVKAIIDKLNKDAT